MTRLLPSWLQMLLPDILFAVFLFLCTALALVGRVGFERLRARPLRSMFLLLAAQGLVVGLERLFAAFLWANEHHALLYGFQGYGGPCVIPLLLPAQCAFAIGTLLFLLPLRSSFALRLHRFAWIPFPLLLIGQVLLRVFLGNETASAITLQIVLGALFLASLPVMGVVVAEVKRILFRQNGEGVGNLLLPWVAGLLVVLPLGVAVLSIEPDFSRAGSGFLGAAGSLILQVLPSFGTVLLLLLLMRRRKGALPERVDGIRARSRLAWLGEAGIALAFLAPIVLVPAILIEVAYGSWGKAQEELGQILYLSATFLAALSLVMGAIGKWDTQEWIPRNALVVMDIVMIVLPLVLDIAIVVMQFTTGVRTFHIDLGLGGP